MGISNNIHNNGQLIHSEKYFTSLVQTYQRPLIFIDFEFNNSQEKYLNLVSCSLQRMDPTDPTPQPVREYWLHNDKSAREDLQTYLINTPDDIILAAYAVPAEARALISLGVDPHSFTWLDLYAEWRQLTFNNYECQYGTYYTKGFKRHSVPPHFDPERNKNKDNNPVGLGMVDCVAQLYGIYIDGQHKKTMRDLILENKPEYTPDERQNIIKYCTDDIRYLPAILYKQSTLLQKYTGYTKEQLFNAQVKRGQFMVAVAKMENTGFPVDMEAIKNLRSNFDAAQNEIIQDLVDNYFPFFERVKKRQSQLIGDWTDKYNNFRFYIEENGLAERWPKTPSGLYNRDDKVLQDYSGDPNIKAYRQAKKLLKQLAWFKEPTDIKRHKSGDIIDNIGSDHRLRSFLGAYGTQTSRNAPKASRFILAMSSWLRCLITPPPGRVIVSIDYASQEFAIAAILSGDRNMVEAYRSGDPYLYFAKKAGAVPQDADPKKCKNPDICSPSEQEMYIEYKNQRGLFKSTTLGLQYGMGPDKLRIKLQTDMGRPFSRSEAEKLLQLHKRVYPRYWEWQEKTKQKYKRHHILYLWDGWALLGDNENILSVQNFPVQGTGAVIMREAVHMAQERGLEILAPLHDAIYMECREYDHKQAIKILSECMDTAVSMVLGDKLKIRLDIEVHKSGQPWIEEKGQKMYNLLNKYLKPMETDQTVVDNLLKTVFL